MVAATALQGGWLESVWTRVYQRDEIASESPSRKPTDLRALIWISSNLLATGSVGSALCDL